MAFFLRQPEASSEFLSTSPGRSQFFGARQMLEPLEKRIMLTYLRSRSKIYGVPWIPSIYPFMLAYIPAPWIRHGIYKILFIDFFYRSRKKHEKHEKPGATQSETPRVNLGAVRLRYLRRWMRCICSWMRFASVLWVAFAEEHFLFHCWLPSGKLT